MDLATTNIESRRSVILLSSVKTFFLVESWAEDACNTLELLLRRVRARYPDAALEVRVTGDQASVTFVCEGRERYVSYGTSLAEAVESISEYEVLEDLDMGGGYGAPGYGAMRWVEGGRKRGDYDAAKRTRETSNRGISRP